MLAGHNAVGQYAVHFTRIADLPPNFFQNQYSRGSTADILTLLASDSTCDMQLSVFFWLQILGTEIDL